MVATKLCENKRSIQILLLSKHFNFFMFTLETEIFLAITPLD